MNRRAFLFAVITALILGRPAPMAAARATSDLHPPEKRQAAVANAERLASRKAPAPLPAGLVSPFNPPDFDKVDAAEVAATPAGATPVVAPPGERETLEKIAAQIKPTGVIQLRGAARLVIGNKPFEVGTRFTATYNNQDYELELVAIDRTTFTLRYRGEETTRPIKPVR